MNKNKNYIMEVIHHDNWEEKTGYELIEKYKHYKQNAILFLNFKNIFGYETMEEFYNDMKLSMICYCIIKRDKETKKIVIPKMKQRLNHELFLNIPDNLHECICRQKHVCYFGLIYHPNDKNKLYVIGSNCMAHFINDLRIHCEICDEIFTMKFNSYVLYDKTTRYVCPKCITLEDLINDLIEKEKIERDKIMVQMTKEQRLIEFRIICDINSIKFKIFQPIVELEQLIRNKLCEEFYCEFVMIQENEYFQKNEIISKLKRKQEIERKQDEIRKKEENAKALEIAKIKRKQQEEDELKNHQIEMNKYYERRNLIQNIIMSREQKKRDEDEKWIYLKKKQCMKCISDQMDLSRRTNQTSMISHDKICEKCGKNFKSYE